MALNEQMQQMIQQDIKDAETRPKAEILQEQMEGLKTAGRTARDIAVESIPGVSEALAEKRVDEALQRGDTTGAIIEGAAGLMGAVPMVGDAAAKGLRAVAAPFKKTRKAYKVAVQAEDKKLYPLFVNADKELPVGTWIEAEFPKSSFKGKRTAGSEEKYYVPTKGAKRTKGEKTKNTGDPIIIPDEATRKNLIDDGFITERTKRTKEAPYGKVTAVAARPGLHASQAPVATHLGPQDLKVTKKEVDKLLEAGVTPEAIKRRGNQYYVKRRAEDQVFVEVEMADDVDYQSMLAKEGKSDINDYVPRGGSYRYSDGQADSDQWVVGGDMKITRVLSREEAKQAQKEAGVVDLPYRDEVEDILGRKFSDEVKMAKGGVAMDDYLLAKITDEPQNFARGGVAKQMELFEPVTRGFDEGGLMDEGGTVDPVSGNDVPPGSTQEEVRDDIPAQLSEGEFVFPADVVRYIGLENLMRMRQEAKQGLSQMEAMGQMGNGDEAVMPDDLPFDMYDLDVEDDGLQMNVGGYVPPSVPQMPYNQPTQVDPRTGTYTLPGTGIAGYQVPSGTPTGYVPYGGATPYFQPVQFTGAQYQDPLQTTNLPTFADTVGNRPGQYDELRTYINDAGQTLQIPFKDGKPIYPIPEGYRPIGDQPAPEEETTVMPTLGETQVMEDDRGRDGPSNADISKGTGMPGYNNPTTRKGLSMLSQKYADVTNPFSMSKANLVSTIAGVINPVLGLVTRGLIDSSTYNSELSRLANDYSFFGSPEDVASLATTMAKTAEDYATAQTAYAKAETENNIGGMANAQDEMNRAKSKFAREATRTAGKAKDVDTDKQGIAGLEGFTKEGKGVSPGPGAPTKGGPGKGRDGSAARSPDTQPGHKGMSDVQGGGNVGSGGYGASEDSGDHLGDGPGNGNGSSGSSGGGSPGGNEGPGNGSSSGSSSGGGGSPGSRGPMKKGGLVNSKKPKKGLAGRFG